MSAVEPAQSHRLLVQALRTDAVSRGLHVRKLRRRDAWVVQHPDGRQSEPLTFREMREAIRPVGRVVIAGADFGDRHICLYRRTAGRAWRDLVAMHGAVPTAGDVPVIPVRPDAVTV